MLFNDELYVVSGTAVALEVPPVMVQVPPKGTFCFVVAFVP